MFQNLNTRERALLLVMVIAVLAAGFYFFLLRPQMEAYASAREQLEVKQDQLQKAEAALRSSKTEMEKAEQVKEQLAEYIFYFDTEFKHGSALLLLSFIAMDLNISITNLEPGGILDWGNYLELPVKLDLNGSYNSMRRLVGELERLPNLTEIRSLKISSSKTSGGKPTTGINAFATAGDTQVEAQCELVIYTSPAPGGRLSLEQQRILAWQTGRDNIFATPGPIAPHPEIPRPQLNKEPEPVEPAGNPVEPNRQPVPADDGGWDMPGEDPGAGEMDSSNI